MIKKMLLSQSAPRLILCLAVFITSLLSTQALTLDELRADHLLTPARLLALVADFDFELHDHMQAPEKFLARRRGDCDDFASLAAMVLREKGYTTRLMVVYMARDVHVVCYVVETKSFLDYNRRKVSQPTESTGTLADVAEKVSQTFRSRWRSVSEFTYAQGSRKFLDTEFQ